MKKLLISISIISTALLFACSQVETVESLEKKLEDSRKKAKEIESNIHELEEKIASLSDGTDNRYFEPVVVETLKPKLFKHYFEASGAVEPVQEAYVSPEVNGQITGLYVKEGDRVQKGQLLARLNTEVTERSLQELETALSLAVDVFERQQRLWNQRIGSEIQYLEAKNNKENLENRLATIRAQLELSKIHAPINGYIEKLNQKTGELAVPGMIMMHVINLDEVYVKADVSERFLPAIDVGDEVVLRFPSYPDFHLTTNINRVGNLVNRANRTFEVQLKLKNENQMLKPNMVAVIEINDYSAENSLVVPSKIIKEDLMGKYLFVAVQNPDMEQVARKRYVVPGRTYQSNTRIESGLQEGDAIIVEGFNRVNDGSLLRLL
jgi:membrane fusion protein, multidrug efflux system